LRGASSQRSFLGLGEELALDTWRQQRLDGCDLLKFDDNLGFKIDDCAREVQQPGLTLVLVKL
jgi:hypothetical protein